MRYHVFLEVHIYKYNNFLVCIIIHLKCFDTFWLGCLDINDKAEMIAFSLKLSSISCYFLLQKIVLYSLGSMSHPACVNTIFIQTFVMLNKTLTYFFPKTLKHEQPNSSSL